MRFASETPSRQVVSAPGPGSSCEPSRRVTSNLWLPREARSSDLGTVYLMDEGNMDTGGCSLGSPRRPE